MSTTMSVQEALNQLKIMRDRITQQQSIPSVGIELDGRVGTETLAEWTQRAKSSWQSASALIANYRALKAAIVQSNAITTITVGKQTMTVAEAIERKTSIEHLIGLRDILAQQLHVATNTVERHNVKIAGEAENAAQQIHGKRDAVSSQEEYDASVTAYIARRAAKVADPLGARALLEQLSGEIDTFRARVDTELTTSNVSTMITVDLVN